MYKQADLLNGIYATEARYYINNIDVTYYIMLQLPLPSGLNLRFFEIVCK